MDRIRINGGNRLSGEIVIPGAKNAALALMPATLLTEEPLTLTNVPRLSDVETMNTLLAAHGVEVASLATGRVLTLSAHHVNNLHADYDIVRKMRASILVLGPLLARFHKAEVSLPGGCAIGARPVDLHLQVIKALGADYDLVDGYIHAKAPEGGLHGGEFTFPFVSVGATETALLASALAKGISVFKNVAREPEIIDLAELLIKMGAQIEGHGTETITVKGVPKLNGTTHEVVMDRIQLGSYMIAPALTGGEVFFPKAKRALLESFLVALEQAGIEIKTTSEGISVKSDGHRVKPLHIVTEPFPGFPTDLQAQLMTLLCRADGESQLEETIFENRFMHAPELGRMGADIHIEGRVAHIKGVPTLKGAPVMATDLRASFSLLLAGLAAEGETIIRRVYHVDRGYEHVVKTLQSIGADIIREKDDE